MGEFNLVRRSDRLEPGIRVRSPAVPPADPEIPVGPSSATARPALPDRSDTDTLKQAFSSGSRLAALATSSDQPTSFEQRKERLLSDIRSSIELASRVGDPELVNRFQELARAVEEVQDEGNLEGLFDLFGALFIDLLDIVDFLMAYIRSENIAAAERELASHHLDATLSLLRQVAAHHGAQSFQQVATSRHIRMQEHRSALEAFMRVGLSSDTDVLESGSSTVSQIGADSRPS